MPSPSVPTPSSYFNPRTPRGVRLAHPLHRRLPVGRFQSTHPARGATDCGSLHTCRKEFISIHAPREGCDETQERVLHNRINFNPRTPRGVRLSEYRRRHTRYNFNPRTPRGVRRWPIRSCISLWNFNPRTPRGVRQQTLPKSREFAWLNLLICTRGRRLSIRKQTRLCSMKLSFMLFGCEPAGEGVSSWTSHATKSKVRLEGRSAYSQSVRSSAHSDFPGNKSGGCPVRDP